MEHKQITSCPLCGQKEFKDVLLVKDHMITKESFQIRQCSACGFHFTNPRPSPEEIGRYYKSEEYVSHSSSKKGIINKLYNWVRKYTLRQKVKLLERVSPGKELLDVGAGTGHFLNACKQKGFHVEGLEPDKDAARFAREAFQLELKSLDSLRGIPAASKDVITMWHVLEHVYDLQADFSDLVRILKDDGVLIIAVPNPESFDARYYGEYWAAYDVPRHLYHFSEKDIAQLARIHGLVLKAVLPMKFDSFYVSMLSEKYKGGSLLRAFRIGLKSNEKAASTGGYSSQIYVLSKN